MNIDPVKKVIKLEIWYLGYSGKGRSIRILFDYLDEKEAVEYINVPIGHSLGFNNAIIEYKNELWDLQTHIYSDEMEINLYHKDHPISLETVDGFIFVVNSNKWAYEGNLKSWNKFISHCKQLTTSKPPIVFNFLKVDPHMKDSFEPMTFLKDINYSEFIEGKIEKQVFLTIPIYSPYLSEIGIVSSFKRLLSLIVSSNDMTLKNYNEMF